jgi:hypothetical protein
VGINSRDRRSAAGTFLREFPVPYLRYHDPDQEIGEHLKTIGLPATIFYHAGGELAYVKQAQYANGADLAADIERHARSCHGGCVVVTEADPLRLSRCALRTASVPTGQRAGRR